MLEKAAGTNAVFISGRGSGWQMRATSDAMPEAAGGEGGHGAAKLDGVIHRYILTN